MAEVGFHGICYVPKANGGIQLSWDAPKRRTEELSVFGEENVVVDDSAPHDVVIGEIWPVGLPVFAVATLMASGPMVGEGDPDPARSPEWGTRWGETYVCGSAQHLDLVVKTLWCLVFRVVVRFQARVFTQYVKLEYLELIYFL